MSSSSMRQAVIGLMVLGTVAAGAPARACDAPGNRVPNCGFDTDLVSWTFSADSAVHLPGDGVEAPGCAAIDRHDGIAALEAFTACLDIQPETVYELSLWARVAAGAAPDNCDLTFVQYADEACSSFVLEPFADVAFGSGWTRLDWLRRSEPGAQSAQLRLVCAGAADFVVRIDDGVVRPALFADGFESGDTGAWSSAVP